MFAADPEFYVRPAAAAAFDRNPHQFADTIDIDTDERVLRQNSACQIFAKKRSRIVARDPKRCLRQIVGSKAEELRGLRKTFRH